MCCPQNPTHCQVPTSDNIEVAGGPVVKTFACCTEGPWFNPREGSQDFDQQNISYLSIACDVKLKGVPCTRCSMLRQVKDPTLGNREYLGVDSQPYIRLPMAAAHLS